MPVFREVTIVVKLYLSINKQSLTMQMFSLFVILWVHLYPNSKSVICNGTLSGISRFLLLWTSLSCKVLFLKYRLYAHVPLHPLSSLYFYACFEINGYWRSKGSFWEAVECKNCFSGLLGPCNVSLCLTPADLQGEIPGCARAIISCESEANPVAAQWSSNYFNSLSYCLLDLLGFSLSTARDTVNKFIVENMFA